MEQAALGRCWRKADGTGDRGGIVSELTFDLILSSFYTIWLKAEPEEHMAQVRRSDCARWRTSSAMANCAPSC
jgi:XRE family aerobic/anaerobic benzoate catabolism transcriptional regulator